MTIDEKTKNKAYEKMAALCSRSEQCSSDIRKKIITYEIVDEIVEEIIQKLKRENFLDDERYARAYVKDKFKFNKWGRTKIRHYLRAKGISDRDIEKGLEEIDDGKYKTLLVKTMKEKARAVKSKKNKFEKMGQIIRFAQNRGFEPELIHRYMNEVLV